MSAETYYIFGNEVCDRDDLRAISERIAEKARQSAWPHVDMLDCADRARRMVMADARPITFEIIEDGERA